MSASAAGEPAELPMPATASWAAPGAISAGAFALVTTEFLPIGLLPQIAHSMAITEGRAGLAVTMSGLLAALAAPATIVAAGTFDRRKLLLALLGMRRRRAIKPESLHSPRP